MDFYGKGIQKMVNMTAKQNEKLQKKQGPAGDDALGKVISEFGKQRDNAVREMTGDMLNNTDAVQKNMRVINRVTGEVGATKSGATESGFPLFSGDDFVYAGHFDGSVNADGGLNATGVANNGGDSEYQPVLMKHADAMMESEPLPVKLPRQKVPSPPKRPSGVEVRPKVMGAGGFAPAPIGAGGFAPAPVGLEPATVITRQLKDSPIVMASGGSPEIRKVSQLPMEIEASPLDSPDFDMEF